MKPVVQTSETDKMKGSYKFTKDRDFVIALACSMQISGPNQKTDTTRKVRDKWKPQVSQKAYTVSGKKEQDSIQTCHCFTAITHSKSDISELSSQ